MGIISAIGSVSARYLTWDFSFPSLHTMLAFSVVPFLDEEFPRFKYVWIALAVIIGFSRIYLGFHFASDVIAGGLLGYIIGVIIIKSEKEHEFLNKTYRKIFRR